MALTDLKIKNAKPKDLPYRLPKYGVFTVRFPGRRKALAMEVSVRTAKRNSMSSAHIRRFRLLPPEPLDQEQQCKAAAAL